MIDAYYSLFTYLLDDPIQADLAFTLVTCSLLIAAGCVACWPFLKELDAIKDEWVRSQIQK